MCKPLQKTVYVHVSVYVYVRVSVCVCERVCVCARVCVCGRGQVRGLIPGTRLTALPEPNVCSLALPNTARWQG